LSQTNLKFSVFLKLGEKMSAPPFSKNAPGKIGRGIEVSGKNTLIKTESIWSAAIADTPIDAKVDGKKMFCVRVENAGPFSALMFGFTPMETFDSTNEASFGSKDFTGCGLHLYTGNLWYPVNKAHNIIDNEISSNAKEIIIILTISNSATKKEIQFLCDGKESKSSDVSEILNEDFVFPAICLYDQNQQITTIPIDQFKTRTPEIERLLCEEIFSFGVEVETKNENKKEKKVKQVATKKTKKETKPKTTKATKKKEEKKNNKEKKTKSKK
jgi:hypothetical protein